VGYVCLAMGGGAWTGDFATVSAILDSRCPRQSGLGRGRLILYFLPSVHHLYLRCDKVLGPHSDDGGLLCGCWQGIWDDLPLEDPQGFTSAFTSLENE
jgi:hypothetical protein